MLPKKSPKYFEEACAKAQKKITDAFNNFCKEQELAISSHAVISHDAIQLSHLTNLFQTTGAMSSFRLKDMPDVLRELPDARKMPDTLKIWHGGMPQ